MNTKQHDIMKSEKASPPMKADDVSALTSSSLVQSVSDKSTNHHDPPAQHLGKHFTTWTQPAGNKQQAAGNNQHQEQNNSGLVWTSSSVSILPQMSRQTYSYEILYHSFWSCLLTTVTPAGRVQNSTVRHKKQKAKTLNTKPSRPTWFVSHSNT